MAETRKPRLERTSRKQINRLLVMWYSHLEREPIPSRLSDLLRLPSSGTS